VSRVATNEPEVKAPGTGRALLPALVAAATLGLGYADLARGGETLAPILLVVGYVVALPWAILRARARA
jgi:hypothetical protein